ncbi:NAD-dependent epimerase/dehydratase family protein [Paenibacillus tritici]|uniref:NAD-dependent epimerase/dehydratase family protein n=1 Tax=Paenibacillus tritici TaxID=1873425 RepID=UPI001BAA2896|nr:NAD-dependent epimerase/dehydratase family protein [Paenibacillus tritici]QUL57267.1 NAD-dependent epimerase/dehydratase family protein [Paenibacillus tritici]
MTKALVTGATGFLGRHTARRLARMGWEVYGQGRNLELGKQLGQEGVEFLAGDLREAESGRFCRGMDVVFHCAALSSPWGKYKDFYTCNVEATRHIVEGCRRHGVGRLVHISTPSVYSSQQHRFAIRESDPLPKRPANGYAATKLIAEQVVGQASREGLPSFMLRPRAIFGPMDNALFPRLLAANKSKGVPLMNGGRAKIDLTCVENVVDAMLLCCEAPLSASGRAYNITNGEPLMFSELITRLFSLLELPLHTRRLPYPVAYTAAAMMEGIHRVLPVLGEPLLTRYSAAALGISQTLDISLAREQLGYHPRITTDEGLHAFAEWWREQP